MKIFTLCFYLNLLCSIQSGPWANTIPDEVKVGCSSGEILLNKALVVWSSSDFCDAKNACMILRKFRGLPEHRSSLKTLKKYWKFKVTHILLREIKFSEIYRSGRTNWDFWMWIFHIVHIEQFYCHSDFTWNQFWLISVLRSILSFLQFWRLWIFIFWKISRLKMSNVPQYSKYSAAQNGQNCRFWGLQIDQNWLHAKCEWQKIPEIST